MVCDDPGMHSSQNEQDSRNFALAAKIIALEPSDPTEAREMTMEAFDLSEELDIPVMVRPVTRISHTKGLVEVGELPTEVKAANFIPDKAKFVMVPGNARVRHLDLIARQPKILEASENSGFNRIEDGKGSTGIIACGICYSYVKDYLQDLPVLKIGVPVPAPISLIKRFAEKYDELLVIEELEPVVERQVRENVCKPVHGKLDGRVQRQGEILPETYQRLGNPDVPEVGPMQVPARPPNMCPGCPHRALMYALKKVNRKGAMGDIGCYTLGLLPPIGMVDACLCMGAGINLATGLYHGGSSGNSISLLGDSTFVHQGITGLINSIYNKADTTIIILDNDTTAMTGFQPHPGTGQLADFSMGGKLDIPALCEACGAKVWTVDPYDIEGTMKGIKEAIDHHGVSVVVSKRECVLRAPRTGVKYVVGDECDGCLRCIASLGCPAISREGGAVRIDPLLCTGCGICVHVCPKNAIQEA